MEELVNIVSNVGFPMAITVYVIVVLQKTLNENVLILTKLVEKIETLEDKLNAK